MDRSVKTLPVDREILGAATDNDKVAMDEIVAIYLREGVKSVNKLRSAVQRNDPDEVAALAHKFLGSSRFLGATQIARPLAALMMMGRTHHLSAGAAQLVDRAEKEFARIGRYFKAPHE